MVLDHDTTPVAADMIDMVILRRDLPTLRQLCQVRVRTLGTMWCEVTIDRQHYRDVLQHRVWHELQGGSR